MVNQIDKAHALMESTGEEIFSTGGASDEVIAAAEAELGVTFPGDYRAFLKKYGTLTFDGEEFYGITPLGLEATSIPCVIFATKEARKRGDISGEMVEIKSSGYGPVFSIDLSSARDGVAPIVETDVTFKTDGTKNIVANSFAEFFVDEVERAIREL